MTLKLIDKELKSKYAEALYKNESSYDKEINRHFKRLNLELSRNSQMVDAGSQIFLNKVRQKRSKWIEDDLRYRDYYRLVCRNVHNKKLDNLSQVFNQRNVNNLPPDDRIRFNILQDQLKQKEMKLTFFNLPKSEKEKENTRKTSQPLPKITQSLTFDTEPNDTNEADNNNPSRLTNQSVNSLRMNAVPKLPKLKNAPYNEYEFYNRYSKSDRDFIDKYPAKVELTLTETGKQYLRTQRQNYVSQKRNKQRFNRIQDNALKDPRYKNLVSYLEKK